MYVEVQGVGFQHARGHVIAAQDRAELGSLRGRDRVNAGDQTPGFGETRVQRGALVFARDPQHPARRGERLFGEAVGWVLQKRTRGEREPAHGRIAVVLGQDRGRAARGVVAGDGFALQHDGAAVRGEFVGRGGAGDAGADDEEVAGLHEAPGEMGRLRIVDF